MLKRLIVVGGLTGSAHLINIAVLKVLAVYLPATSISIIGEIDSLVLLIISIVNFGIQLSATRKLALLDHWQQEYYHTQSARITLALLLWIVSISGFLIFKNFLFLMAPVFALNGDYALYGRGMPKTGALISFLRVLIPSLALLVAVFYFPEDYIWIYISSVVVAYIFAGITVSRVLGVAYFVKPNLRFLKKYYEHLNIGICNVFYSFVGVGLINVIAFFYNNESIAALYLFLKIYILFRGVKQIIVQSFFKDLNEFQVAVRVDYYSLLAGFVFFATLAFFTDLFTLVFLTPEMSVYHHALFLLGLAAFVSTFSTGLGARLLLAEKDKVYSRNMSLGGIVTILSSVVFYYLFGDNPLWPALSILTGELIITILDSIAIQEQNFWKKRLQFILPAISTLGVPLLLKNTISNEWILYLLFLIALTLITFVFRKKWIDL